VALWLSLTLSACGERPNEKPTAKPPVQPSVQSDTPSVQGDTPTVQNESQPAHPDFSSLKQGRYTSDSPSRLEEVTYSPDLTVQDYSAVPLTRRALPLGY